MDQNLFNASQFTAKNINNAAHPPKTSRCRMLAFLFLYKSIQKNKNTMETTTIKKDNNVIF
jgi:hypothetical protein